MNQADFTKANEAFVESFKDGGKPLPPARKAVLITCMDGEGALPLPPRCCWHCTSASIPALPCSAAGCSRTMTASVV